MHLTKILLENLKNITETELGKREYHFLRKLFLKAHCIMHSLILKKYFELLT